MDAAGWAPQSQTVRLLDGARHIVPVKNKSELTQVRAVELTEATLLSVCIGNKAIARVEDVQLKEHVPAVKPGRFSVAGLGFPKLQNGELIELEVLIAADQILMMIRR